MPDETKPKPPKLTSASELMAKTLREEAAAYRVLANRLRRAELAGEWEEVGAVRSELAQTALGLEAMAEEHER